MPASVVITCPRRCRGYVEVRDRAVGDDWSIAYSFTVERGESRGNYIHRDRRLVIEEVPH